MLATIHSGALWGVESMPVEIEVNTGERGELRFILVGLPDAAVRESLDRVCSALQNSHFLLPRTRTTINLSPGHLRKEGPLYDLPIALGMLLASGQMAAKLGDLLVAGELSLSGKVLPIRGSIALAIQARKHGLRGLILPRRSAEEALIIGGVDVYAADTLGDVVDFLQNPEKQAPLRGGAREERQGPVAGVDFADVLGQSRAKRAAEIAVAGGHNLLMVGSPGVGKSMLAKRVPTILPRPTCDELEEIYTIHSAAAVPFDPSLRCRPFRAPHHSISRFGLIGGGSQPRPGEISLAHRGVLFLDELAEFPRPTLDTLRQPLDDGQVTISRICGKVTLPSAFTLVAAMNPCPCGYAGSRCRRCRCSQRQIHDYRARISGPIRDRMDLQIDIPAVPAESLGSGQDGETSERIRGRVEGARERQRRRGSSLPNAHLPDRFLRDHCPLGEAEQSLLRQAAEQGALSARAFGKILRVARTIADLEERERISNQHLVEALQYRALDWS